MLLLSSLKFLLLSSMSYLSYLFCPTPMFNLPILLSAEGFTSPATLVLHYFRNLFFAKYVDIALQSNGGFSLILQNLMRLFIRLQAIQMDL